RLVQLDDEAEARGRLLRHLPEYARLGDAVVGRVDLDTAELVRVVAQMLGRRQARRIERAHPVPERGSGRADEDPRSGRAPGAGGSGGSRLGWGGVGSGAEGSAPEAYPPRRGWPGPRTGPNGTCPSVLRCAIEPAGTTEASPSVLRTWSSAACSAWLRSSRVN